VISVANKKIVQQQEKPISDDAIFKMTKEVIVKFIEVGRLSPDSFSERFSEVYKAIRQTVRSHDSE